MDARSWILETYEQVVRECADTRGALVADVRDTLRARFEAAVADGSVTRDVLTPGEELDRLYVEEIAPLRRHRREDILDTLEVVLADLDALNVSYAGMPNPALELAFPLGTGRDKDLKRWTVDDFQQAAMIRYDKAAQATAAAARFSANARAIVERMRAAGVLMFGDLLG